MGASDLFLLGFDADKIGFEHYVNSSRQTKREYIKQGYDKQMSLYGAVWVDPINTLVGVRIEILSKVEYSEDDLRFIYNFFMHGGKLFKYSIWTFQSDPLDIKCVGAYP